MSIVSTLVFLSQSVRHLAFKMKNKDIVAIDNRITKVEAEQVKLENHRSNLMVKCNKSYYDERDANYDAYNKALAALESKFTQRLNKIDSTFAENKRTIALTSQAASNQLKSELTALRSELYHLTK